ncbi:hypothetical protein HYO14_05210 [Vibrio parahaemolyticus]|nr:hypothetical protein [Vibrio parahaemolyticus]MBM5002116.1 hypothetical protein [Vibrio parahaemolyticus]
MSIINNANPGSNIEALYALDKVITLFSQNTKNGGKRLPLDRLMSDVTPSNLFLDINKQENGEFKRLDNPEKKVKETLRFWGDAGLWDVTKEGVRSNHPVLDNTRQLPQRLLKVISRKEYDLFKGNDIEPFLRFLIFFLCIDDVTFVGHQVLDRNSAGELVAKLIDSSEVSNAMSFNTNERPVFFAYAHMLGFLEQIGPKSYFVDPTRAIKAFLPSIFESNKSMSFDVFLTKLNECLPIFDQGKYRQQVEKQMIREVDIRAKENGLRVSASLSVAIERLIRERMIGWSLESDSAIRYSLTLPNGEEKIVSNVQFLGDK